MTANDRGHMPRSLRIVLTGFGFLSFGFFGVVIAHIVLPLTGLGIRDPALRRDHVLMVFRRCCRIYLGALRAMGLFHVEAVPEVTAVTRNLGPSVIIANHPSLLDILVILAHVENATFVAKPSWFRNPLISPILRVTGAIPGPHSQGGSPMDGALVLDHMLQRLRQGLSIVVFPEGTRSLPGRLHPFHKGAFEVALRAQVPLVALFLRADPPTLLKNQPWYEVPDRSVRIDLDVLEVVFPSNAAITGRAFRSQIREVYACACGISETDPKEAATESEFEVAAV